MKYNPFLFSSPPKTPTHNFSRFEAESVQKAINLSLHRHPLEGGSGTIQDMPFLIFRIPDKVPSENVDPRLITTFPDAWEDCFGSSMTFSVKIKGFDYVSKVVVFKNDPAFPYLQDGRFIACYVKGNKPIVSYPGAFSSPPGMAEHYCASFAKANNAIAASPDRDAHFWTVQRKLASYFKAYLSKADCLSIGWIATFNYHIKMATNALQRLADSDASPDPDRQLSQPTLDILLAVRQKIFDYQACYTYLAQQSSRDNYFTLLLRDVFDLGTAQSVFCEAVCSAFFSYQCSPAITKCGKHLSWLQVPSLQPKAMEIDVNDFPADYQPQGYWASISNEWRANWGELIKGSDRPVGLGTLAFPESKMPTADNAAEAMASANTLLEEAVSSKKWTIPPGATVQLSFGPFAYLQAYEIQGEVHFVCRTQANEFSIILIDPYNAHCSFVAFPSNKDDKSPEVVERKERIEAAVKLLLSAIIRDFWVVEDRERVFAVDRQASRQNANTDGNDLPIVVYLPRVHYSGQANIKQCETELAQEERRAHFVRAHLRKSAHASSDQQVLAQRYGFSVPVGYTFVRPHERGKKKRETVYRSRSALQCLYTVFEYQGNASSHWFQFERDVYSLMEALGFSAEHISASRRGDYGVDVYATKGTDFDKVNWIIQCKCYAPKRKIGPNIIRDIVGTLCNYPPATRGMVVTTSSFTSGARKEADKHGIRLIDGAEFLELVESTKRKAQEEK